MAKIQAIHEEITDRLPMASFIIRTDGSPLFELALAGDPSLFRPNRKSERTPSNFYSTRAVGLLPAERGEALYIVPPAVLQRLAVNNRLYYGLATFSGPTAKLPTALITPNGNSHWIGLGSFSGARMQRRMLLMHGSDFSGEFPGTPSAEALTWAGDAVAAQAPGSGGQVPDTTAPPQTSPPVETPPAGEQAGMFAYDDGYGAMPEEPEEAASEQDDAHGIEGPIPDDAAPVQSAATQALMMAVQPEYPQASRFAPADASNYRRHQGARQINRVVIHITDGGPNINGPISWFQNPKANVSAHYIVGRDGDVVQMVKHNDVAWHARSANSDSIGIEHVANTRGLNPTESQYCDSAALLRWLCDTYSIPMDRAHILGHSEADPKTTHRGCPNAVWDWDYFMGMVQSATCYPRQNTQMASLGYGRPMAGGTSRPWSDFFHFPAGTRFRVDGPAHYNGNGQVLELTNTQLRFSLSMPELSVPSIPPLNLTLEVNYSKEGSGNSGSIIHNGNTYSDNDITIITDGNRRRIRPSVTIPGHRIDEISVAREDQDEIDLDITYNGKEWDFDLERINAASQAYASSLGWTEITHAGPYKLAYDFGNGKLAPIPKRDQRKYKGDSRLQTALNDWANDIPRVMAPPKYILNKGTMGDVDARKKKEQETGRKDYHIRGLAIDITGFWWSEDEKWFLARGKPIDDWSFYLRAEASLRKVFGVVLNYDYNTQHQDHWHCDLSADTSWRGVKSQALFAQRVLKEIWGENIAVDGRWGSNSQAAASRAGYDFSQPGHWDRFLDDIITQQSSQAAGMAFHQAGRSVARPMSKSCDYDPATAAEALVQLQQLMNQSEKCWQAGVEDTSFFPHSAICQLRITDTNGIGNKTGTGFYVAPDLVLTCAHNMSYSPYNHQAQSIVVTPGRNNEKSAGKSFSVGPTDWELHPRYTDDSRDFDLAVIRVSVPPPNGEYFRVLEEQVMSPIVPMIMCGYSGGAANSDVQNLDGDAIRDVLAETYTYNTRLRPGSSGGPVFYVADATDIHVTGVNVAMFDGSSALGCRLTDSKIQWIYSHSKQYAGLYPYSQAAASPMSGTAGAVVSSIAGAAITRILDNEGDISWQLDQLSGLKHPFNNAKQQGTAAFQTRTIKVNGPQMTQGFGIDAIYANADLSFQYNGHSLGNVQIAVTEANDALGAGLEVKAEIMDDANTYRQGNSGPFAALRVRFQYRFTNPILNDAIMFTDFVLYGNGTYNVHYRWDVDPISGKPRYQSLEPAYT